MPCGNSVCGIAGGGIQSGCGGMWVVIRGVEREGGVMRGYGRVGMVTMGVWWGRGGKHQVVCGVRSVKTHAEMKQSGQQCSAKLVPQCIALLGVWLYQNPHCLKSTAQRYTVKHVMFLSLVGVGR